MDPALSWVELNIEGMKNLWGGKKSVLQRFNWVSCRCSKWSTVEYHHLHLIYKWKTLSLEKYSLAYERSKTQMKFPLGWMRFRSDPGHGRIYIEAADGPHDNLFLPPLSNELWAGMRPVPASGSAVSLSQ